VFLGVWFGGVGGGGWGGVGCWGGVLCGWGGAGLDGGGGLGVSWGGVFWMGLLCGFVVCGLGRHLLRGGATRRRFVTSFRDGHSAPAESKAGSPQHCQRSSRVHHSEWGGHRGGLAGKNLGLKLRHREGGRDP